MTPAAQYAQKRADAVELIRQHAPTRLQDSLIELLRPAIALSATRVEDSQIPLGASKFGGAPDVPLDFLWPTWNEKPLGFLAQINLEEVAPFDVEELLPQSGLLSFFYDLEGRPWGYDPKHKGGWRVIWVDSTTQRALETAKVHTQLLSFGVGWTIQETPEIEALLDEAEQEADEDDDPYSDFYQLTNDLQVSPDYLLGWPDEIQNPMELECQLASNGIYCGGTGYSRTTAAKQLSSGAADWILLAQFEFDEVTSGRLYFWIRKQDLAARNFADVWLCFQTT